MAGCWTFDCSILDGTAGVMKAEEMARNMARTRTRNMVQCMYLHA